MAARPNSEVFYFQVPDSDETGVVQSFQDALEDIGAAPAGETREVISSFRDMAAMIGIQCGLGVTVVIDEFQYFHRQSLSPFTSYLQEVVDGLRDTSRGGLFVLGSIHTEMTAILEDHASPLFNRVTHRIEVSHWDFATLVEMFRAHGITDPRHWLFLWSLFEGVPKFYRDCFDQGVLGPRNDYRGDTLRRLFFEGSSPLRDEAHNWFLRELRGRYDSVLKILARLGPCSHGQLVAEYAGIGGGNEKQLASYLRTLIDRYQMVEKRRPIFSGGRSRKARYRIADNFLASWLSSLSRAVQMARIQPVATAVQKADAGLKVQEGVAFEKMIRLLTQECSRKGLGDFALTEMVDGYWNKADASDIEIDLVALNGDDQVVRFGSCKRSARRHHAAALTGFSEHVARFLATKEGRRLTAWRVEKVLYAPVFSDQEKHEHAARGFACRDLGDFARILH